jgi:hypothetical protein
MVSGASFSDPGWQGCPPPALARGEIDERYRTGDIKKDLATFLPLPYRCV